MPKDKRRLGFIETVSRQRKGGAKGRSRIGLGVLSILGLSFVVFVALAAYAVIREGPAVFISTLLSAKPSLLIAAVSIILIADFIEFPKWELYIKRLKINIQRRKNFLIYLSLASMDITPGRWGRIIASYSLNRITKVHFGKALQAVVADIFTDFLGFVIVALASAFFVKKLTLIFVVILALTLFPFILLFRRGPYERLKARLARYKVLNTVFEYGDMYFDSSKFLDKKVYLYSLVFTIPAMLMNGIALMLVIMAFGISVPLSLLPVIMFIYASSIVFGMASGAPATLGVTDVLLVGYLTFFFPAASIGLAIAITLVFRIITLWLLELFGFVVLFYTFRYWEHPSGVAARA